MKLSGIGLCCHSALLPKDLLAPLHVDFAKVYCAGKLEVSKVRAFVRHYGNIWWVWHPKQGSASTCASILRASGVRDVVPYNEPIQEGIDPVLVAKALNAFRGRGLRVYLSLSTWDEGNRRYAKEVLAAGGQFDGIDLHPYLYAPEEMPRIWKEAQELFGCPVILGEIGWPEKLGAIEGYRAKYGPSAGELHGRTARILRAAGITGALYEGPNVDADTGLFDSADGGGTFTVPTAAYHALLDSPK